MDSESHEDVLYNNKMGNEGNDGTENDVPENLDGVERSSEMSPAIMRLLIRCMGEPQNMMQRLDSTKNKQDKLAIYLPRNPCIPSRTWICRDNRRTTH